MNDKAWKVGADFGDGFKIKAGFGADVQYDDAHQQDHHQEHRE